ncbi:MAG TPA: heme-binding protein [Gemmatimonadales bacterium]|nr:heme-binding protein [Gemmatimonadales bacterium]
MRLASTLTFAALTTFAVPLNAQLADTKILTQQAVQTILQAATVHAGTNKWNVSIAVVDANGDLLAFRRLDGASLASVDISQGKARTAARARRATKALADAVAGGATVLLSAPGLVLMQGGLPITVNGITVGAVGVSGASSEQDEQVAAAGIAALKP